MNRSHRKASELLVATAIYFVLAGIFCVHCVAQAQDKKVTETAGVANTKMGAYEALAEMSFQAFKAGNNAAAAELARVLERTWDAAEGGGGDHSLGKINEDLFDAIDRAMDGYIKPVMNYDRKTPDPASVEKAYNDFLAKLKQAD